VPGGNSIVTSGSYERYFEVDEKLYHHILDPTTGYPRETDLISVSVIAESAIYAEILSTTVFMLGLDEGMALINSLAAEDKSVGAVLVTHDGRTFESGYVNFLKTR
jgi:thiamine biosynthesis lipoprotein